MAEILQFPSRVSRVEQAGSGGSSNKYEAILDRAVEKCSFDSNSLSRLQLEDLQALLGVLQRRIEMHMSGSRNRLKIFLTALRLSVTGDACTDHEMHLSLLSDLEYCLQFAIKHKQAIMQRFPRFQP